MDVGSMVLIEKLDGRMVGRLVDTPEVSWLGSGAWDPANLARLLAKRADRCSQTQQAEIEATVRKLRDLKISDAVTVRRARVSEGRRRWRTRR